MNKIKLPLALFIVGITIGYVIGNQPSEETKQTSLDTAAITRKTERQIENDGSIKETIYETEKRSRAESISVVKRTHPRRFLGVSRSLESDPAYQVEVGYRVFSQVAVKGSITRYQGEYIAMVGLQLDF